MRFSTYFAAHSPTRFELSKIMRRILSLWAQLSQYTEMSWNFDERTMKLIRVLFFFLSIFFFISLFVCIGLVENRNNKDKSSLERATSSWLFHVFFLVRILYSCDFVLFFFFCISFTFIICMTTNKFCSFLICIGANHKKLH